jgi:hypothetical protein
MTLFVDFRLVSLNYITHQGKVNNKGRLNLSVPSNGPKHNRILQYSENSALSVATFVIQYYASTSPKDKGEYRLMLGVLPVINSNRVRPSVCV